MELSSRRKVHALARKILSLGGLLKKRSRSIRSPPRHSVPEAQSRFPLLDFPVEIVQLIFEQLPLPEKACLALSCKTLHTFFSDVLKDKRLEFPRLHSPEPDIGALHQLRLKRTQLLHQLEDNRWKYCAGCLKLHPPAYFPTSRLAFPPEYRRCAHDVGIVDLCPCLALTSIDRARLETWLREGRPEGLRARILNAFHLSTTDGQRCLVHECTARTHTHASIKQVLTLTLDSERSLSAKSLYHIHLNFTPELDPRLTSSGAKLLDFEPIHMCPHRSLVALMMGFIVHGPQKSCRRCETTARVINSSNYNPDLTFEVVRGLGAAHDGRSLKWIQTSRGVNSKQCRDFYIEHGEHHFVLGYDNGVPDLSYLNSMALPSS